MHTQGEWKVESRPYAGDGSDRLVVYSERGRICTVSKNGAPAEDEKQYVANARLIATAPELLKLCKTAFSALKSYQYGNASPELAQEVAEELELLIEKAEEG